MSELKVYSHTIVFQEVPNEVSLAINISGCPHHCEGCHSPELAEDVGNDLGEELPYLLKKYRDFITCVCFMGGDQNMEKLKEALQLVRSCGLKTAVYSGLDSIQPFAQALGIVSDYIDYLKIGHYDAELGGLSSPTTNQRMYRITDKMCGSNKYIQTKDITSWFQRKSND